MLEKMKEMIAEQLGVDVASVEAESRFKEDLEKLLTVQDVIDYLKDKGVEE